MALDDIVALDAVGQAEAIQRGDVSALELTDAYLARIDRLDGELRAFVKVDADGARHAARAVDDGRLTGPLAGATISIKDVVDVAGLPTTHSCDVLANSVASDDDPVVRRFRDAGTVLLGKTNVPEFCTSMTSSRLNGTCRNPWDMDRTPGGSSGGAAAAVAAGLCAAAHGTDGAGSVRGPAAYCGLVGLKPTRRLVDFGPLDGPTHFQTSEHGILARSVRDVAALLDAIAPPSPWTPHRDRRFLDEVEDPAKPLRIGVCVTPPHGTIDQECVQATNAAASLFERLGHEVDDAVPAWELILPLFAGPQNVPGPARHVELSQVDRLEPRNRPLLERMTRLTALEHYHWIQEVRAATREFLLFWDEYDILVTPTMGSVAPLVEFAPWHLTREEHIANFIDFAMPTHPFNVTGQPAISVPLAESRDGLPIGIQLAGRLLEDNTLLRLAAQLEEAEPWAQRLTRAMFG